MQCFDHNNDDGSCREEPREQFLGAAKEKKRKKNRIVGGRVLFQLLTLRPLFSAAAISLSETNNERKALTVDSMFFCWGNWSMPRRSPTCFTVTVCFAAIHTSSPPVSPFAFVFWVTEPEGSTTTTTTSNKISFTQLCLNTTTFLLKRKTSSVRIERNDVSITVLVCSNSCQSWGAWCLIGYQFD